MNFFQNNRQFHKYRLAVKLDRHRLSQHHARDNFMM